MARGGGVRPGHCGTAKHQHISIFEKLLYGDPEQIRAYLETATVIRNCSTGVAQVKRRFYVLGNF